MDELRKGMDASREEMREEMGVFREQVLSEIRYMRATLKQHNERIRTVEVWVRALVGFFVLGWLSVFAMQAFSVNQLLQIVHILVKS